MEVNPLAWKLNREAYNHAVQLIESGHVTDEAWEKPRLEDFKDLEEYDTPPGP